MSDDRFNPEENPLPATPCRRWIDRSSEPVYVTADEMDAWLDEYERRTGTGKHRRKRPAVESPELQRRDRGDGQFGIGDAEPEPVE